MIPQTAGTLLAFLALVAPGMAFELLRERRRPQIPETTLREASRIALVSLVFTAASLALVWSIPAWFGVHLVDFGRWLDSGAIYFKIAYTRIFIAFALEVATACTIAFVVDFGLSRHVSGKITSGSVWFHALRIERPVGATPWLHIKIDSGDELYGYLGKYTTEAKQGGREISIKGPKLSMHRNGDPEVEELESWASIVVREEKIVWMKVAYVDDHSGNIILTARKDRRSIGERLRFR